MDTFCYPINTFKCPVCNEPNFPLFEGICYNLCNHPDNKDYCQLQDFFRVLTPTTTDFPLSPSPKNDETNGLYRFKVFTSTPPYSPDSSSFFGEEDEEEEDEEDEEEEDEEDEDEEEPQDEDDDEYLPLPPLPSFKSSVKSVKKESTVKSDKSKKKINFMKKFGDKNNLRITDNDDEILHKTGYTKYQLVDMDLSEKRKRFVFKSDLYDYVSTITRRYKNRVYARHSRSKKIRN